MVAKGMVMVTHTLMMVVVVLVVVYIAKVRVRVRATVARDLGDALLFQGVLERLQLPLVDRGVNDPQEDGRSRGGARQRVLDGGVVGDELGGQVVLVDVVVVRREVVALVAEGADPDLGFEVDAAEGVEDGGAAALADDRLVRKDWQVLDRLERRVEASEGDHHARGLKAGGGPHIPREAHAVGRLHLVEIRHRRWGS